MSEQLPADQKTIRVLVTDDSAFMRRAIRQMLEADPLIEVVDVARNGLEAIEKARELKPDAVTLDIEMPEMDGLTALRQIKRVCRAAVLMISSLTTEGSQATLTALRYGASDFIAKDVSQISLNITRIEKELHAKIRAIVRENRSKAASQLAGSTRFQDSLAALPAQTPPRLLRSQFDVIVIGSSTGGPPVLEHLLSNLPAAFDLPVVIAQHMPVLFTKVMAERLNNLSRLTVVHAENRMELEPRHAYVAPGGLHARLMKKASGPCMLDISPLPRDALYKPSVSELFRSAAETTGARTLAIVLTGMGEDGLAGARPLHAAGGRLLAQDHESCAVYGMPKAVTQAGLVMANLNPNGLLKALSQLAE